MLLDGAWGISPLNNTYSNSPNNSRLVTIEYLEDLRVKIEQLEGRIESLEKENRELNEIRKRKIEKIFTEDDS
jgi:predicted nuclease with TOPRIM domain